MSRTWTHRRGHGTCAGKLAVQGEITKGSRMVEDLEIALQGVMHEKNSLLEVRENGSDETRDVFLSFQQHVFETDLKAEEMEVLEEELKMQLKRIKELEEAPAEKKIHLSKEMQRHVGRSWEVEDELQSAVSMIEEPTSLLANHL
ncbi:hypothetical protein CRG98_035501 [Punica granatum]|uniref:Uncharacterized protein n=1 Tax=Punica granatum TaxID=22663 RepID=A0A2I0IJA1_PUNGR|nr:hypothetical protein CRG98_035501 [Punica granatum]